MFSLVLGGCTKSASTTLSTTPSTTPSTTTSMPTSTTTQATGPISGGVLVRISAPPSNPIGWPPASAALIRDLKKNIELVEPLWYIDEKVNVQPMLAESWDWAPDRTSITFHLRKGVKFHDGTDWNAQAAKFMFDAFVANKNIGASTWKSIDVVDDNTLRISFSQVTSLQKFYIANVRFISLTAYQQLGKDGVAWNPIGTGPFKMGTYVKDVSLTVARNDNYWGKKPYLDGIKWVYSLDDQTAEAMMIAGNANLLVFATDKIGADLKNKGFEVRLTKSPDVYTLLFDSANPDSPFAKKEVRQAVNYAIDRQGLCDAFGYGYMKVEYQIAWSSSWGFNPGLALFAYDPVKARQLLKDAGYPNGFPTDLTIPNTFPLNIYTAIQANLQSVGIDAKMNIVDIGAFIGMTRISGWKGIAGGIIEGLDTLYAMAQKFSVVGGKGVYSKLKVPEGMQPLLDQAVATEDFNTQKSLVQQMAKLSYDEAMVINFASHGELAILAKGIHDFDWFPTQSSEWWDPCKVWLDKDARK